MNWRKLLVILTVSGISVFTLFCVLTFLVFNGGFTGVLKSFVPIPDWQSTNIEEKRKSTTEKIDRYFQDIETQANFTKVDAYSYDYCVKGDHSWKRNDPFAYECSLVITHFYVFNDKFRDNMTKLDLSLTRSGWKAEWKPMENMLKAYYDDLKNSNYGKTGLVSSLPRMRYTQNNNGFLTINYLQKDSHESEVDSMLYELNYPFYQQVYHRSTETNNEFKDIFAKAIQTNKYFLAVSISNSYFSH